MTIGSLFRGTWAFIKANPSAIAIWSLLNLALIIFMHWGMGPFYEAQAANAAAQAQGLPPSFPPFGRFLVTSLILLIALVALYNAVFRAVLRPEERHVAYLRLGKDELRLIGLMLLLMVAWSGLVVVIIILAVVAAMVFHIGPGSLSGGLGIAGFVLFLALWCAMIFVTVRLVAMAPLTLYRQKIMIGPAWKLTSGHFWRLFAAFVLIGLLVLVVSIPLLLPTMGPMFSSMGHPGDPAARQQLAILQAQQMGLSSSPMAIMQIVLSGVFGGLYLAIFAGMPAIATQQLLDEKAGIAAA